MRAAKRIPNYNRAEALKKIESDKKYRDELEKAKKERKRMLYKSLEEEYSNEKNWIASIERQLAKIVKEPSPYSQKLSDLKNLAEQMEHRRDVTDSKLYGEMYTKIYNKRVEYKRIVEQSRDFSNQIPLF